MQKDLCKLNIGCGGSPLPGYINIDQDDLQKLRLRYPDRIFADDLIIAAHDVFNLPYENASVDEVNADAFIEHLSFEEEPRFLSEVARILKPGGLFSCSAPDFEAICKLWLQANDEWQNFYVQAPAGQAQTTWFGSQGYDFSQRWGYLMTSFYGTQNAPGQFHKNGYSEAKFHKMMTHMGFKHVEVTKFTWKGNRDPMLKCKAIK